MIVSLKKKKKSIKCTPRYSGHFFLEPRVSAIGWFDCIVISRWEQGQIGIKLAANHVIPKFGKFHKEKRISMLTGLKVSSVAYKYVFYRPEHNAKSRVHRIEF